MLPFEGWTWVLDMLGATTGAAVEGSKVSQDASEHERESEQDSRSASAIALHCADPDFEWY